MNPSVRIWSLGRSLIAPLVLVLSSLTARPATQSLQVVSARDVFQPAPVCGDAESLAPVVSRDGRYVLFASSARDLVSLSSSNVPLPTSLGPKLNVYLRDRNAPSTVLVSINAAGAGGGNGDSVPLDLSTNGQFALFESFAGDLASADTNRAGDIYLRDLYSNVTSLVSVNTNGVAGKGFSTSATMTPDGRYVAFVSAATDLVTGDTNGIPDVFVRDLQAGITVMASAGARSAGSNPRIGNIGSEAPEISADGRYVAFYSSASNLVSGVKTLGDIYVRDLNGGTTIWASAAARSALSNAFGTTNGVCFNHALSADGRFVAYQVSPGPGSNALSGVILRYGVESGITDLICTNARGNTGPYADNRNLDISSDGRFITFVAATNRISGTATSIQVWDAQTGAISVVSGDLNNLIPTNSICDWPTIEPTGRLIAFLSATPGLTTNATVVGSYHIYLRDLQTASTVLIDGGTNGAGPGLNATTLPRMSADGVVVAFECADGNLVENDRNHAEDVFVWELTSTNIELVSIRRPEFPSHAGNGRTSIASHCVSDDGHWIVFASDADNLVVGDTNATREVFVRDMVAGTNLLASVAVSGVGGGDESSWEPSISGDGRYVAFTSRASNLVAVDANHASDVFVRDLQAGTTALVSVNTGGSAPGNNDSYAPSISADGRCVLFFSRASNLALGSSSSSINLLWRDLQGATTYLLANNVPEWLGQPAAMTPDGRYVVIAGPSGVTLWDATSAWVVFSATIIGVQNVGISPDGNRIAYATATQLQVVDRLASSNVTIAGATPRTHPGLRFSGDNRFLAYSAAVSSTNEVYLYDFESGANQLASHSFNSSTGGNASADSPEISNDGRFVLYRSAATNLVPNDTNGVPDIFLYDRLGDTNVALSLSSSGASLANNRSLAPAMSADGRTMAFLSWASDLEDGDFNQTSDAFAISPYTPDAIPPFQVAVSSGGLPNQGAFLTWPAVPGKTYRAQFKENLSDQLWQDLNLPVVIAGSTGSLQDITPAAAQRFYRIVAF